MSELSPLPGGQPDDALDLHQVAAALRADAADVQTYAAVLTSTLGETLPDGMVEVVRRRSLGDRMAGRDGTAEAVVVRTDTQVLTLHQRATRVEAEIATVVRGVTISRRSVGVDEWADALAAQLGDLARRSAAAREALQRMLGG